jgi:hypothetical protein
VQNYGKREGSLKTNRFSSEAGKYGLNYDYLRPKVGEPPEVYRVRKERTESWMKDYGGRLVSLPAFGLLSEDQKKAAIESLRRRIGTQQNNVKPNLDSLDPDKILSDLQLAAAGKAARDAKKLHVGK